MNGFDRFKAAIAWRGNRARRADEDAAGPAGRGGGGGRYRQNGRCAEKGPLETEPHETEPLKTVSAEIGHGDSRRADDTAEMYVTRVDAVGEYCSVVDSPFRILQLASKGKITELERLYFSDPTKRNVKDTHGRSAVHLAAKNGHVVILDFLSANGADLDVTDGQGDTALHLAVEEGHEETIDFLLTRGADPSILNHEASAPIHRAVDLNKPDILQALLRHEKVDPNLAGNNGATPLHCAAYHNHADCARVLVKSKAKLCKPCNVGLYPLHIAAQKGSSEVFEIFINHAEAMGYKKCIVMRFNTQEKNTPLHVAINAGSLQTVKMCLSAGATVDSEQEDGCTAVHMAAGQGSVELLKVMFEMQPEKTTACLNHKNKAKETPLHRAALFNRAQAIDYLIEQGATLDCVCTAGLTPMLMAAEKGAWEALEALLKRGSCPTSKDLKQRNVLHLVIMNGGKPKDFNFTYCASSLKLMLNEKDDNGCTPLHYASKKGHITTMEDLVRRGAELSIKNNNRQAPLHFAAKYGRYNTCKSILDLDMNNAVNETDGGGQTPLHQAACNGHTNVVRLLLQRGAGVFRDLRGNTPLHIAAMSGYTHTMQALLDIHANLLDVENKDQETPIHLAAKEGHAGAVSMLMSLEATFTYNNEKKSFLDLAIKQGHKDTATAIVSHDRWQEVFMMKSMDYGCPFIGLISYMPDVCQMVLDRCRTTSGHDPKSAEFHYVYDFAFLQLSQSKVRQLRDSGEDYTPLMSLNMMVKFNRLDCLTHPVCLSYLQMKWRGYGMWFHFINLLIYLVFITSLTAFVATYNFSDLSAGGGETGKGSTLPWDSNTSPASMGHHPDLHHTNMSMGKRLLAIVILAFSILNVMKEVVQIVQQRWMYFTDLTNLLEWILYITCTIFIGPFVADVHTKHQWECGALAVFLAWFNLLLYLQRFDFFGIYVVMFLQILKTLVQVLIVFSILIIAFGMSFYILLNSGTSPGYKSPGMSLMSTCVMMLGNIDYLENWVVPYTEGALDYSSLNFVMLIVFILLMPILLINLMIGLAVGDIEAVQKDARLRRIAMQVQLHTELEKKLPQRLIEFVDKTTFEVYPNACGGQTFFNKAFIRMEKGSLDTNSGKNDFTVLDRDDEHHNYLYDEMHKQKHRMKSLSGNMQKQNELLRLIVQKMEIHTEADDVDEQESSNVTHRPLQQAIGWSSPSLRQNLIKQSSIVTHWKGHKSDKM